MTVDRKSTYKLPPTTITDRLVSQEARRAKALEDQKRRRAERVDSFRNLDQFADLTIGGESDDDEETTQRPPPLSVAQFAGLLNQPDALPSSTSLDTTKGPSSHVLKPGKANRRKRRNKNKSSKWADKCMYAELLEMTPDLPWSETGGNDGLPADLECGWVAVGPVPVGKRCLAVTHQSSGVAGVVPNTTLRSRLLGKVLIQRFPSILPPMTILDCILDANWRHTGILHVLDVIKWKGQDISDCEASFRFWWRDTRLNELTQGITVPISFPSNASQNASGPASTSAGYHYQFSYPNAFIPVPYTVDTSLNTLYSHIIPAARSLRTIPITVPTAAPTASNAVDEPEDGGMDVDSTARVFPTLPSAPMEIQQAAVASDGLLLYVKEASYESSTSPLSSWIPVTNPEGGQDEKECAGQNSTECPLDLFQRLVARRMANRREVPTTVEIEM